MKPELGCKIAEKLGMNPDENDIFNAQVYINRHTRAINPNFPMIRAIEYAPWKPKDTFAFILVTKHADDHKRRKFRERRQDVLIKRFFMKLRELKPGDLSWDTVLRNW
ncbi:hypothetical protein PC9H_008282 [Pleurotus ostreatus]|uniref:Uncharacterized protein n=1 Tax=Pleurotus ostreatus TaxID=5322 RepID=A0A8H6ZVG1_PLEOS|nr:uncharacterized protein PC9H_008282 [Pleurotus ostreatus]KAF7425920.1 hypothetical protein PC9H_008282 [Pleurotus ostreatus]